MTRLQRKISPIFSATLTHPRTRDARRRVAEFARRVRGAPHRVLYFHQVDDPYGHLVAQVLGELAARYDVVLEPHLVGPPPDDARPHLDGEGWREEVEENRRVLMKSGLWGVPSFRLLGERSQPDFCTWGQDRLWLVEEIARRRAPCGPAVSSA
jgi:2-hydroxychromene-2-carboxylate isomerase